MPNDARIATAEMPVLLTTAEVARILRVDRTTLSRWRTRGVGPRVTWLSPSVPRYQGRDVLSWLEKVVA